MTRTVELFVTAKNRSITYDLSKPADVLRYVARQRYAWPGGYELLVCYPDGVLLCSECIKERYREELEAVKDYNEVGYFTAADIDPDQHFCEHCGKDCSAYAEELR